MNPFAYNAGQALPARENSYNHGAEIYQRQPKVSTLNNKPRPPNSTDKGDLAHSPFNIELHTAPTSLYPIYLLFKHPIKTACSGEEWGRP